MQKISYSRMKQDAAVVLTAAAIMFSSSCAHKPMVEPNIPAKECIAKEKINSLVGELKGSGIENQTIIRDELVKIGTPAVPALTGVLKENSSWVPVWVRESVVSALAKIAGDHPEYDWKETASVLVGSLGDENPVVKEKTVKALVAVGIPALPALGRALADEDFGKQHFSAWAIESIAKKHPENQNWKPTVDALIGRLGIKYPQLFPSRETVIWSGISNEGSYVGLVARQPDECEVVNRKIVQAIVAVGVTAIPELIQALGNEKSNSIAHENVGWTLREMVKEYPQYDWKSTLPILIKLSEHQCGECNDIRSEAGYVLDEISMVHPEFQINHNHIVSFAK